jgi:hypothetical protein
MITKFVQKFHPEHKSWDEKMRALTNAPGA